MLNYKKLAVTAALSASILTGCFGPKPEEQIYTIFEHAATQEKTLYKDAASLEELEKQNQQLYAKIIQDGKENNEPAKEALSQATKGIQDREAVLNKERDALDKAQKELKDTDKYMKQLEDSKLKKQGEKVESLYKERYADFQHMYDAYKKALTAEKALYDMLGAKTEKVKTISDKVKEVNQLYAEVESNKEKFNTHTKDYNKEKVAFYKQANFKIEEKTK
ncbi:YkyA family protein [Microbacteriaceae bacterium 4G12]